MLLASDERAGNDFRNECGFRFFERSAARRDENRELEKIPSSRDARVRARVIHSVTVSSRARARAHARVGTCFRIEM